MSTKELCFKRQRIKEKRIKFEKVREENKMRENFPICFACGARKTNKKTNYHNLFFSADPLGGIFFRTTTYIDGRILFERQCLTQNNNLKALGEENTVT